MKLSSLLLCFFLIMTGSSCRKDKCINCDTNYPVEVDKILVTNCAKSGCHNETSKDAAAGLDLSKWDNLFNGAANGAAVVPFSSRFSTLLYFVNTDTTEGLVGVPTMPLNASPLSKSQYQILRDWINAGAPDKNGMVAFSDNPNRKKIYVSNQGCDNIAVIDAERKVIMRYFDVGTTPGANPPESPHSIKVTPDNKYLLVIFSGNQGIMQVYDVKTDLLVKTIPIDVGGWNTFAISSDSRNAYLADFNSGKLVFIDLVNLVKTKTLNFGSSLNFHGIALNPSEDTLYVGQNTSSELYKVPINDVNNWENVNLNAVQPVPGNLMPHEILFSPDGSRYFVTCEGPAAHQLRIYNTANDQLIKAIALGEKPVEMSISKKRNLIFVTCMEDNFFPFTTGSVRVINMATLIEEKIIEVGWQPHGLVADDQDDIVYVANRNYGGPAPHHAAACGGQNGYMVAIDMNTLQLKPDFKAELSVDPYSITIKN